MCSCDWNTLDRLNIICHNNANKKEAVQAFLTLYTNTLSGICTNWFVNTTFKYYCLFRYKIESTQTFRLRIISIPKLCLSTQQTFWIKLSSTVKPLSINLCLYVHFCCCLLPVAKSFKINGYNMYVMFKYNYISTA